MALLESELPVFTLRVRSKDRDFSGSRTDSSCGEPI
jgi:hypothetical protein